MVNYGNTTALGLTESVAGLVPSHSVVLSGLAPGMAYYYEVQSTDVYTNTATDDNGGVYYSFTTPDTTPPVISGVQAVSITDNFATIEWTTDEAADSVVNYGNTTALGLTESVVGLVPSHSVVVSGLEPGMTYYYEVQSTDAYANTAIGNNTGLYYSFTTTDTTPPVISGLAAIDITTTTATIAWTTDEPADSVVNYGPTPALGLSRSYSVLVTGRSLLLSGLDIGTTYYYEVQSTDGPGNTAVDDNGGLYYTFATLVPDPDPPVIGDVQVASVTETTATIEWDTDEPADSVVRYGNTTALGLSETDASLLGSHSIVLTGLDTATTYYYEVESTDGSANTATDDNGGLYYSFTTLVPDVVPPVISGIQATNIRTSSATVIWTTDEPAGSVVRYGNTTALGLSESYTLLVAGHSVELSGLDAGTVYYYEVESTDVANNTATDNDGGLFYSFATLVPEGTVPVISAVQAIDIHTISARITWTTDEPADSLVRYGANTTTMDLTASDASLVTSHLVLLSGLDSATTYDYVVQSADGSANTAIDDNGGLNYSFASLVPELIPPVISSVQAVSIDDDIATITWTTDEPATSVVNYGTSPALGLTVSQFSLVTSHSVQLSGLEPGTMHYYEVQSADGVGNVGIDDNSGLYHTFITTESVPPVISGIQVIDVKTTSVTITWITDEPTDSVVRYGGNVTDLGFTESDPSLVTSHSIVLNGLSPGTTYYYQVESTDWSLNTTVDDNGGLFHSFATLVPEFVPPVISGVLDIDIKLASVTITWSTDEKADSVVNYGNTTALGLTAFDIHLVTDHAVVVSGLNPGATYYYEVRSTDGSANTAIDSNGGLYYTTTTLLPESVPPVIAGVAAIDVKETTATIIWNTNEPADSVVNYGDSTVLGLSESYSGLVTSHAVYLSGLSPGTMYYYEIQSTDGANNTAIDDNGGFYYGFSTLAPETVQPVISVVEAVSVSDVSATILWVTDEPADSLVRYGANVTTLDSSEFNARLVTNHSVALGGLTPVTTYYYEILSTDGVGNTAIDDNGGTYYTFATTAIPDTTPPVIGGVGSADITMVSATINWTTDEPADSVVRYGTDFTALDLSASDVRFLMTHSVSLGGLEPGNITYYYEVQSMDVANNTAVDNNGGQYYTFATDLIPAPEITDVVATAVTGTAAVVTWTTDMLSTSVVRYGTTIPPANLVGNPNMVTDHAIPVSGLEPTTTYYFEVESTGETGQTAIDNNGGAYYTLTIYRLTGWGWCTDYEEIANAEFVANVAINPVPGADGSSQIQLAGTVNLTFSDSATEEIVLEMYGTKVRSLFSAGQEVEGKSASLRGVWMVGEDGQYLSGWGHVSLPEGRVFKTGKLYVLHLRTADVDIPERQPGSFVDDLEYLLTLIVKFFDGLIDRLMLTDFADILGRLLAKLMILLAAVRDLGIPYIP